MNSLRIWKHRLLIAVMLMSMAGVVGQTSYKESFKVGKDALVSVNTSYTNVIFETWNKDEVEVYAYIDDDDLSNKEKKELFDQWNLDVLGNSSKVVISSDEGNWGGWNSDSYKSAMKALSNMPSMEGLGEMPTIENMPAMDFDVNVPDLPDFKDFPQWPFSKDRPSVVTNNGGSYSYNSHMNIEFDEGRIQKGQTSLCRQTQPQIWQQCHSATDR